MKNILWVFVMLSATLQAQELKLEKATMQTIHQGASPVSVTTYTVTLLKNKKFCWSIDSVCGIQSGQKVDYKIVKVDDPTVLSPDYKRVEQFKKSDRGRYQISFSKRKVGQGGRPNAPQNLKPDTTNIEGGVVIHYTSKKRHRKLLVENFEQLETVNAP
jgi:hypothetical protein